METARHRAQMNLLIETLGDHWAGRDDFYVGGNMFVYFSQLHAKSFRGPDVFVVLDTTKKPREKWEAWEEGGKLPDVVIELLSDSTREIDRGEKLRIYERVWKVATYVLYDPFSHALEGFALGPRGRFVPLEKDERGDLPVEPLGLTLGLRPGDVREEKGPFLRWIERGVTLPSGDERAETERRRADDEHRLRARAEARIAELEAQLAALRRE